MATLQDELAKEQHGTKTVEVQCLSCMDNPQLCKQLGVCDEDNDTREPEYVMNTTTKPEVPMYTTIEGMAPSPYRLGHKYLTVGGDVVRLTGISHAFNSYQTMFQNDEWVDDGTREKGFRQIHRYTARDFGRVTGTDHKNPDPRNLRYPPVEVV